MAFFVLMASLGAIAPCAIFAQNAGGADGASYFQERTVRFVQRLAWEGSANVYYYEVLIERAEPGPANANGSTGETVYTEALREKIEQPFINCSLSAGSYRYRVTPYNFLEQPGESSAWAYFTVYAAYQPEISTISPGLFDLGGSDEKLYLEINGNNLDEKAEVFFYLAQGGGRIVPETVVTGAAGNKTILVFNKAQLASGFYDIVIRNPGGLETSWRNFYVRPAPDLSAPNQIALEIPVPQQPVPEQTVPEVPKTADETAPQAVTASGDPSSDLSIAIPDTAPIPLFADPPAPHVYHVFFTESYAPLVPLWGYINSYFGEKWYPLGFSFRMAVFPFRSAIFGFELAPAWQYWSGSKIGEAGYSGFFSPYGDVFSGHFFHGSFNILTRFLMAKNHISLTIRLGGGMAFMYDFHVEHNRILTTQTNDTFMWLANGGLSFQWYPGAQFYMDISADYIHVFFTEDYKTGYIQPSIGFGIRF